MNPFAIDQVLTVQFGQRQRFAVAAVTQDRCAMRSSALPYVHWYTVADLLRWNPQPAIHLLPAPKPRGVGFQDLRAGMWIDTRARIGVTSGHIRYISSKPRWRGKVCYRMIVIEWADGHVTVDEVTAGPEWSWRWKGWTQPGRRAA